MRLSQSSVNLHRIGTPEFQHNADDILSKTVHSGPRLSHSHSMASFMKKSYEAEDVSARTMPGTILTTFYAFNHT